MSSTAATLVEAQLRGCLNLPQRVTPSRKPRCAVVDAFVFAPATGRLTALPLGTVTPEGELGVIVDVEAALGQSVTGTEDIFSTVLAEVIVSGKNLKRARSLVAEVLRDPPVIAAVDDSVPSAVTT